MAGLGCCAPIDATCYKFGFGYVFCLMVEACDFCVVGVEYSV